MVTVEKRRSTANKASPMTTGTVTISVHSRSQEQRALSGSGVVSRFVSRAPQELIDPLLLGLNVVWRRIFIFFFINIVSQRKGSLSSTSLSSSPYLSSKSIM